MGRGIRSHPQASVREALSSRAGTSTPAWVVEARREATARRLCDAAVSLVADQPDGSVARAVHWQGKAAAIALLKTRGELTAAGKAMSAAIDTCRDLLESDGDTVDQLAQRHDLDRDTALLLWARAGASRLLGGQHYEQALSAAVADIDADLP